MSVELNGVCDKILSVELYDRQECIRSHGIISWLDFSGGGKKIIFFGHHNTFTGNNNSHFFWAHQWYKDQTETIYEIFQTNSIFHESSLREKRTMGTVHFLSFMRFLLVLTEFSFQERDWALGNYSMKFWDFPDIF